MAKIQLARLTGVNRIYSIVPRLILCTSVLLGLGCSPRDQPPNNAVPVLDNEKAPDDEKFYVTFAREKGWLGSYNRGLEITKKISVIRNVGDAKIDIAAYLGERVAFIGGVVAPGGTNDVYTEGGIYLRIVSKEGKDLRPQAVRWTVLVCGEILQVLPEHRIIVLEVSEKDWIVLDTT